MSKTAIEWTEHSWNPIVGCSIVSPGCTNCYAMKRASRIEAMSKPTHYEGTTRVVNGTAIWTGKLAQAPDSALLAPLRRKKPTTYFVNSMGDLFHEDCPDEWIDRVFAVMALTPQHIYQVLTKRALRMRDYAATQGRFDAILAARDNLVAAWDIGTTIYRWPLPNVWLGVSTERQQEANERIPLLLHTPAAIRFISAEPLIGPINLEKIVESNGCWGSVLEPAEIHGGTGQCVGMTPALDWVIVGGESGHDARPMHPRWALMLRDQCKESGVPFFFKQWGEFGCMHNAKVGDSGIMVGSELDDSVFPMMKVGKKRAGRILDGIEHNGFPEARA